MKNKPLQNKRGAIMASAVMFMTLLTFMGVLLTSIILYSQTIVRTNDKIFQTRLKLDQIGEYFLHDNESTSLFEDEIEKYGYQDQYTIETKTENDITVTVLTLKNSSGTTILYIEKDGKTAKVWRYSDK